MISYAVSVTFVPFTLTVNNWFASVPAGSSELVSSELDGGVELSGSELSGTMTGVELSGTITGFLELVSDEVSELVSSELVCELVGLLD